MGFAHSNTKRETRERATHSHNPAGAPLVDDIDRLGGRRRRRSFIARAAEAELMPATSGRDRANRRQLITAVSSSSTAISVGTSYQTAIAFPTKMQDPMT